MHTLWCQCLCFSLHLRQYIRPYIGLNRCVNALFIIEIMLFRLLYYFAEYLWSQLCDIFLFSKIFAVSLTTSLWIMLSKIVMISATITLILPYLGIEEDKVVRVSLRSQYSQRAAQTRARALNYCLSPVLKEHNVFWRIIGCSNAEPESYFTQFVLDHLPDKLVALLILKYLISKQYNYLSKPPHSSRAEINISHSYSRSFSL